MFSSKSIPNSATKGKINKFPGLYLIFSQNIDDDGDPSLLVPLILSFPLSSSELPFLFASVCPFFSMKSTPVLACFLLRVVITAGDAENENGNGDDNEDNDDNETLSIIAGRKVTIFGSGAIVVLVPVPVPVG